MSLQGSLRSLPIPDLLSLIHQQKKTGLLSLVSRQEERGILFQKGNLVYATTIGSSLRLGHFLVRLGYISESELEEFRSNRAAAFLGQDLVARGRLREEELTHAVQEQLLDILDEALLWEEGAFHFDEWHEPPPDPIPVGRVIPTQSILLEAIRRFDEFHLIRASFPSTTVVLRRADPGHPAAETAPKPVPVGATVGVTDGATDGELVAEGTSPARTACLEAERPAADPPEQEILALVDGKRSVSQVLRESHRSTQETCLILSRLTGSGHLVQAADQPAIEESPSFQGDCALPVAPDLPGRIYWVLRQRGKHVEPLAEAISREPTLAAKALRQYGLARIEYPSGDLPISRMIDALGELRTRTFVLPDLLRGVFFAEKDFFWKDCREHSVITAHFARDMAGLVGYPRPEEAYLAGLLHNLGAYVLLGMYPDRFRTILREARRGGKDMREMEREAFGMSHVKAGAIHAQKWRYPRSIAETIRLHHQPGDGSAGPLVDLVALAVWLAGERGGAVEFSATPAAEIDHVLSRFRLNRKRVLNWVETSQQKSLLAN